jgi:hypothetical protein
VQTILFTHILAGALALIAGYVALYAAKGGRLHRRSGMLFVYTMLVMCAGGVIGAAAKGAWAALNVPAGLLTATLVLTSLTTVRSLGRATRAVETGAMLVALGVALFTLSLGINAIAQGGKYKGMPAFPFLMFGVVGLLAGIGDVRMLRNGRLQGARRIARHLWRMTFALFIAAMSFFIGQAKVIPQPWRIRPLLALPVVAVLVTMLYWMWRMRTKRAHRVVNAVQMQEAA